MTKKEEKKLKKERQAGFVLSGPTNFQPGIHLSPDNMADPLSTMGPNIPDILRFDIDKEEIEAKRRKEEEQLRRKKKEEEHQEQKRQKKAQREEEKEKGNKISITGPLHVEHKLHVDENLNWTDANSLQLLNKLGEGAYGVVYRALHVPTNSELAIKTVPISEDSEESSDILKEINILKQCRHDNVVSLYGCVFSKDTLWIIMDYCGAGSVKDFMKHSPRSFTEQEISAVLYYVLQGLIYLHSISIIHRDLKSANILLTDTGDAKIADFGVSYQVSNTLAKKNTVVGTPLFMSPESLDGGDYSEKADIWSLAITAIEMHDGQPPHNDEHIMRAMLLITQNDPPTLSDPSTASDEFNNFLSRCLKKNRDERPTATELLNDPFFEGKDHRTTLKIMVGEYKGLMHKKEMEKRQEEDEKRAEMLKEKQEERQRKAEMFERMEAMNREEISSPRNRKDHFAFLGGADDLLDSRLDVQDNLNALENMRANITKQLNIQRTFVDEAKFYATMPYEQLVDEIREMKAILLDHHHQFVT